MPAGQLPAVAHSCLAACIQMYISVITFLVVFTMNDATLMLVEQRWPWQHVWKLSCAATIG